MNDEILFEFQPLVSDLSAAVENEFPDDEILESNAFTGAEIITIILGAGKDALFKVLGFFNKHRQSLKDAKLRIGKDEFEMSGYSINEINSFIESGNADRVMDMIKTKKHGGH